MNGSEFTLQELPKPLKNMTHEFQIFEKKHLLSELLNFWREDNDVKVNADISSDWFAFFVNIQQNKFCKASRIKYK